MTSLFPPLTHLLSLGLRPNSLENKSPTCDLRGDKRVVYNCQYQEVTVTVMAERQHCHCHTHCAGETARCQRALDALFTKRLTQVTQGS